MRGLETSIGAVILFILVLLVLFKYMDYKAKEGFTEYDNNLPLASHRDYANRRAQETNTAMSLINQISPIVPATQRIQTASQQALNTTEVVSGGLPGEFQLRSEPDPLQFNREDVDFAARARLCQEYATTADCSNWDRPTKSATESDANYQKRLSRWQQFTRDCGLSLDKDGTNMEGKPHMGGLFVGEKEKIYQLESNANKPNKENQYVPTVGTAKKGLFSLDKASCVVIQEKSRCTTQKNFDVPGCSQCYIQDSWQRLDKDSQRLVPELFLGGSGSLRVTVSGKTLNTTLATNVQKIELPDSIGEGAALSLQVSDNNAMVYGYLAGSTKKVDPFRFELLPLVEVDQVSGLRPVIRGFVIQDDIKMNRIVPVAGKKEVNLIVKIPFTFIDTEDDACVTCNNSPFITQKSSADFLNSNPCFGPNAKPGAYNMDCLREKFLSVGGVQQGKGFPRDSATAAALNYDKQGKPRDISQIGEFLYDMAVKASMGRSLQGNKLSIEEWNEASLFMLGKPVKSPCHGQENLPGKDINQECLQFLYRNQGEGGEYGSTYTADFTLSSLLGKTRKEKGATYCQPGAPLDPSQESGKAAVANLANLEAVKKLYNETHARANNNSQPIQERARDIKECYNVDLAQPPQEEVYWVGPGYNYTFEEAADVASKLGGKLATYQQLYVAWMLGANWCKSGWVAEGNAFYPINEQTIQGCADKPGVQQYTLPKVGINVYGIKPAEGSEETIQYRIRPFNDQRGQWNSKEVFQVLDAGYDKTKDEASKVCADVGAQVATFEQLEKAYLTGAQWCSASWVANQEKPNGLYPMQQFNGLCGGNVGIMEYGADYAPKSANNKPMFAVNCYGIKPNKKVQSKKGRTIGNFFTDAQGQSDRAYSAYDLYQNYRPISVKGVGLAHPYYCMGVSPMPRKVQIQAASIRGGLLYAAEQKLGLFEMVPSVADRFTFTIYPGVGGDWEKCAASGITKQQISVNSDGSNPWDNTKSTEWNISNQKKLCEGRGKCFNEKNGGSWCYEPNEGKNVIYIRANTGMRVGSQPNGVLSVNAAWDGPWESWYLEPIAENPGYVALRSHFGKYLSHDGLLKWMNASAMTVGDKEKFILVAKD